MFSCKASEFKFIQSFLKETNSYAHIVVSDTLSIFCHPMNSSNLSGISDFVYETTGSSAVTPSLGDYTKPSSSPIGLCGTAKLSAHVAWLQSMSAI